MGMDAYTHKQLSEYIAGLPRDEKMEAVQEALDSGRLGKGRMRAIIEREFAKEIAWEREAEYPGLARRLALDGFERAKKPVYLRFGDLPAGGRSTMEVEGLREGGVSVFAGRRTKGGHYVISTTSWEQTLEFSRLCGGEDRPAFFVKGQRCGRGGANEPLLRNVSWVEPVPDDCVVAVPCGSYSLDLWNIKRFGAELDEVPALARFFTEEAHLPISLR